MRKSSFLLYIISLVLMLFGVLGIVLSFVFSRIGYVRLASIISFVGSICEVGALILIIIRVIFFGFIPVSRAAKVRKSNPIKTVNVKPVKEKTQQQSLVEQFEALYKEGLISKEDFEKKKHDILN